jgi:16S rRNA (cytidine1402-2'-O)-methyltransferase
MAIHLIPCPIVEGEIDQIPGRTLEVLHRLHYFVVERAKTARRFIKVSGHPISIPQLIIFELNKHDPEQELNSFLEKYGSSHDIGILSEAGCPGIADPGHLAVRWAHRNQIKVVPHIGPSSILLALMAAGMNGQNFAFHGYLPNKKPALVRVLRQLEQTVQKKGETQLFIETPYRNRFMMESCLSTLSLNTLLGVAVDIGAASEEIMVLSVKKWKNKNLDELHKRPAVFLIGK